MACSSVVSKCLTAAGAWISLSLMTCSVLMEGRYGLFFSFYSIFSFALSVYIQVETQWHTGNSVTWTVQQWMSIKSTGLMSHRAPALTQIMRLRRLMNWTVPGLYCNIIGWCLFLEAFSILQVRRSQFGYLHRTIHRVWWLLTL